MRTALCGLFSVVLMLVVAPRCGAETREWTDASGKFKITAEYVEVADGVVKLRTADAKILKIPLGKLSTADRQVVRDLMAKADTTGPITSLVRVIVPLPSVDGEGEGDEITLVGFAIETADSSPVIVVSRATAPEDVDAADLDAGLAQAQLYALRAEDELGTATGAGIAGGDGGREMAFDGGRDMSLEGGRDINIDGGREVASAAPAAAADSPLIILRATTQAAIPMLRLAPAPPAAGEVVTIAKLPRPQVRTVGTRRPPIPWTPWKILPGQDLQTAFDLQPQDGGFPFAATLPILNAKQEVVGVLNPGVKVMPDKSRVASALGLAALHTALAQANIPLPAPPVPPPMAAAPPMPGPPGANPLAALFSRFLPGQAGAGQPGLGQAGPAAPWRTDYEALRSSISVIQGRDGGWEIQWGAAPDLGAWYDQVRMAAAANLASSGGRDMAAAQQAQQHEQAAAQALAQLQGVEWTAGVTALSMTPDVPTQLDLAPLPEPLRLMFVVDPQDAANWSRVQAGDRVRIACRFSATELTDFPTIVVFMTLKESGPALR